MFSPQSKEHLAQRCLPPTPAAPRLLYNLIPKDFIVLPNHGQGMPPLGCKELQPVQCELGYGVGDG